MSYTRHMVKKVISFIAGIVVALLVMLFLQLSQTGALTQQAICVLGLLSGCVVWWVTKLFPEFVTALVMAVLFVLFCGVPTETAFSSFASSTWWLLVAAFSLGFGMQKSGLMHRMASAILRVFPQTFKMQSAGLMAAGTLIGPFIPSLSTKATMLAPLALGISDSLGYERQSREATGLFLAMFTGIRNIGPAVISSSIIGYGLVATLPADIAAEFDMLHWFVAMLPWFIFVMVASYLSIVLIFAPKREINAKDSDKTQVGFTQDSRKVQVGSAQDPRKAHDESDADPYKKESFFSSESNRMAAIMVCCLILWLTEPLHGIQSHIVAITAMVMMLVCRVVTPRDLRSGINWESLIFIGIVLGLAADFAYLHIDEWIVSSCAPLFELLAQNLYMLILGVCVVTVALRFVIVSEMAYINIFMAFMVSLALALGINPWIIGVSIYAVVNPWFVLYQNPIYLSAYYATEEKMPKQSLSAKYCALYLAICICGLMISVPYWSLLGIV